MPLRRKAEWLPAVFAVLYLGGIVAELRADAQNAEIVRQIDTEADRFRQARGI